jgi:cell division septal protein FtsQ
MPLTAEQLDGLASRYLDLAEQIEKLAAEQDTIKALVRDAYPDGLDATTAHGVKVTVYRTRRFDARLASTVVPAELLEQVTERVVDRAKAKALLPPALYEQCQSYAGRPTVRIA